MDSSPLIYDSLIGGTIRMARRHWYVVAAVALLAMGLGLAKAAGGNAYTARGTLNIALDNVATPSSRTERTDPTIDPMSLALRVTAARDDIGIPDSIGLTVTGDLTAGSLTVVTTADSEKGARDGFTKAADAATAMAVREATQSVRTRAKGLETVFETQQAQVTALDAQIAQAATDGHDVGPSSPLVIRRAAAAADATATQVELAVARSQIETLSTGLMTVGQPVVEQDESSVLLPIALLVAGAILAVAALGVSQALDGRLRRRIQIERDVPGVAMLGAVSKKAPAVQLKILERSLARFADSTNPERIVAVDLGPRSVSHLIERLHVPDGTELVALDAAGSADFYGDEAIALIFVVPFGRVAQQDLQAAVADARTAGSTKLGAVLTEVPTRDHSWAAVSID